MESVYIPSQKEPKADLREVVAKYITAGRYNPMRSVTIAAEYKTRREELTQRRIQGAKDAAMCFQQFNELIEKKLTDGRP